MQNRIVYPNRNNTDFPLFLKNTLKAFKYDSHQEYLKYYQFVVYKYLSTNDKARGLLLYIETGYGKTITAVSISEYFRENTKRNIIIITPKSLIENYRKTVEFYSINILKNSPQDTEKFISQNYNFITLSSSKLVEKIKEDIMEEKDIEFEKNIQLLSQEFSLNKELLENSFLVVDEAHNLFNSIANGSANALKLYNIIMNTKNMKILFLTGTPMINDPLEISCCFNMLSGYKELKMGKAIKRVPLLPEIVNDFYDYFVDVGSNTIKNKEIFTNRIYGLVSYYGHIFDKNKEITKFFPKLHAPIIEYVNMSTEQLVAYCINKEKEDFESSKKTENVSKWRSSNKASTSYKVKTRLVSNLLVPEEAVSRIEGKIVKNINNITKEHLTGDGLKKYSPKIHKMFQNIDKHRNQLGLIYSNFVELEGLGIIAKALKYNGYEEYSTLSKVIGGNSDMKRYAIISGKVDVSVRASIVDIFSSKDNFDGKIISLLLISSTGAEGLDLKNVRHVHALEPFWNWSRMQQVFARAVRFNSHQQLKEEERDVTAYIYIATISENDKKNTKDMSKNYIKCVSSQTTDEKILNQSLKNKKLIDNFRLALIEASIDCNIHKDKLIEEYESKINCKLCIPSNEILYMDELTKDSIAYNACKQYEEEEIEAKEIEYKGEKYYYILNDKGKVDDIYTYIKNADKYISLRDVKDIESKKIYMEIVNMIESGQIEKKETSGGGLMFVTGGINIDEEYYRWFN